MLLRRESNKRPLLTESFIHAQFNTHYVLYLKSALEIKISVGLVLFSPRGVPKSTFSSVIDSGWKDLLSSQQKNKAKQGTCSSFRIEVIVTIVLERCLFLFIGCSQPLRTEGVDDDIEAWFEATEDYKNVIWQPCLAVRGELLSLNHN